MPTYTKHLLSESINGRGITVSGTSTSSGTLMHTTAAGTDVMDEIWLYAYNSHAADVVLTIEWGEATDPDGHIVCGITKNAGLALVVPGLLLQNELAVKAFADEANVVTIHGYVNRITS